MKSEPGARYLTVDYSTNPAKILEDLTEEEFRARLATVNRTEKEKYMSYENQQVNLKIGSALINLTGATEEDLSATLRSMGLEGDNLLDLVGEAASICRQIELAKGLVGATAAVSAPSGAPNTQNRAAAGGAPGDLSCEHGKYRVNAPKKKDGGDYIYEYSCPSYKCKPGDLVGQVRRG